MGKGVCEEERESVCVCVKGWREIKDEREG